MIGPAWSMRTRSRPFNMLDAVLALVLAWRIHGAHHAVRNTAVRIRHLVPYENSSQMSCLGRHDRAGDVVEVILAETVEALNL